MTSSGPLPCGERAVRCLLGEPVDRVPFGVGLGWNPWPQTRERWQRESGIADLEEWREFGYDRSFALPELECGIWPGFPEEVLAEDAEFVVRRDARGVTARHRRDGSSMPQFLDYPVKTAEDWRRLKEERLQPDAGRVRQDWAAFRARLQQTGEAVQVGAFPWGVFGSARDLMGVEALCIALCEAPELVRDIMGHLTSLWLWLWEQVAAQVSIDHIHVWEDMSGKQGSLISPHMVETFLMPCYDRIAAFAREHGVRLLSVDTDGDCRQLVPIMMQHGVNVFLPFEVQAGNDVLAYREQYPTLGIIGGLDKRALAGTRADVDREVEKAARMVAQGRYVPGFDHLIPPDARWDNFRCAAEKIRAICYGGEGGASSTC